MGVEKEKIYTSSRSSPKSDFGPRAFLLLVASALENCGTSPRDIALLKTMIGLHPEMIPKIQNAFSKGQLASKRWLCEELSNHIDTSQKEILVLGGWIGLLPYYLIKFLTEDLYPKRVYSLDIDPDFERIVDGINYIDRIQEWRIKGITGDMYCVDYSGAKTNIKRADGSVCEVFLQPDIIINTSTEHLKYPRQWWGRIPKGKKFVIQSNNLVSEAEHHSCVNSLDEFKDMFPAANVYFNGELNLGHYDRFMIIGER